MHRVLVKALHALAAQASPDTTEDSAQNSTARTLHSSFFAHHTANISAAVVYDDAQTLCLAGDATCYMMTIGLVDT